MRTYKTGVAGLAIAGALAIILSTGLVGSSEAKTEKTNKGGKEKVTFASVEVAYRQGIGAYRAGRMDLALPALEHAAKNNNLTAMFLLAGLHSGNLRGLSVKLKDDLKAFRYYQHIATKLPLDRYRYPDRLARVAADVFIALAKYHRDGLKVAKIRPSHAAAVRLYRHAAVNFHDPVAEFRFAKAFRTGVGIQRNYRNAARWFFSSATKNYAPAQAMLGQMYWNGEGVTPDKAQALALLKLAIQYASENDLKWIRPDHDKMDTSAGNKAKVKAGKLVILWQRRYGAPHPAGATMLLSQKKPEKSKKLPPNIASKEQKNILKIEPVYGKSFVTVPTKLKGNEKGGLQNANGTLAK